MMNETAINESLVVEAEPMDGYAVTGGHWEFSVYKGYSFDIETLVAGGYMHEGELTYVHLEPEFEHKTDDLEQLIQEFIEDFRAVSYQGDIEDAVTLGASAMCTALN